MSAASAADLLATIDHRRIIEDINVENEGAEMIGWSDEGPEILTWSDGSVPGGGGGYRNQREQEN